VNGFLTDSIDNKNSVQQGCPLSMILFVLYIEPLIREMSAEVSGANVGIETIKVLGYADDINVVVQNDEESDRVFAVVDRFCNESNAMVNLSRSAFLRMKNCKLGNYVKGFLWFFLCKNMRNTTNANYNSTINFLIN
jgi:hypothetical protein